MKFRVFELGHRRLVGGIFGEKGMIFKSGSIVEKWDEVNQIWIYVNQVHPDDTIKITKDHEVRKMQEIVQSSN